MPGTIQRPKLIVIAGPNGSGKTTFTNQVLRHDWSAGCIFINPDEIAREIFGDWNSPDAVMKAVIRAQELREECLQDRKSMLLESVFSAPDKLDFILQAKEADFFIPFNHSYFCQYPSDKSFHLCHNTVEVMLNNVFYKFIEEAGHWPPS